MRKNLFLILTITALGFATMAQKNDNYDDKDGIEGSGNVITKDFTVKSFDELIASGVFNLQLSQGDKESVKIEADDNLMDLFIVENEGSTLKISMKKHSNFNSKKQMKVYITFKSLKSMNLSMVGGTSSDEKLKFADLKLKNQSVGSVSLNMTLQTLNLENESVGSVKLEGSADNAVVKNNSVGSINAGNFVVQKMEIDNTGVGSATVNAEKELKYSDSFLGKVSNKGNATVKKKNKVVI
jgi:Putative auto-transporter adhesin, head GIN domain